VSLYSKIFISHNKAGRMKDPAMNDVDGGHDANATRMRIKAEVRSRRACWKTVMTSRLPFFLAQARERLWSFRWSRPIVRMSAATVRHV